MLSPESDRPVVGQASRALEENGEGLRGFRKIAVCRVLSLPACAFGKIKRAFAVCHGKCQAFL